MIRLIKITPYQYFGASPDSCAEYDSYLSVWLSVDPLSDMYPSTSPFMYVRGNPVVLVDPNGMSDKKFGKNSPKKHWWHFWKKGPVRLVNTGKTNTQVPTETNNTSTNTSSESSTTTAKFPRPKKRIKWFGFFNDFRRRMHYNAHTQHWNFGWGRYDIYRNTTRNQIVAQGNNNTGPINYTSNNPYQIIVNFNPPGTAIVGTLNGQPSNLFASLDNTGRALNARGRLATGGNNSGPAGDTYNIVFPASVTYTWMAIETNTRRRKWFSIWLPIIWQP